MSWTVYSVPGAPTPEHLELGEAEYALRSAVRSAADALGAIRAAGTDVADPRGLVEQVLEAITGAAGTGSIGDGKVFVFDLEHAVRIRTGETGDAAL